MFLDQAQAIAFSGFMEGQVGPDPDYGTCLQCAAIDRARLKTSPVTPRSAVCASCFKKYCYAPEDPPREGQIVGRRLKFKDPDPPLNRFYERNVSAVLVGAVVAGLAFLASLAGCVIFWRRRSQRRTAGSVAYRPMPGGGNAEWSAYLDLQGAETATPGHPPPGYDEANAHYAEPGYGMGMSHYTEMSDATAHDAEPSHVTVKSHIPEPEPPRDAAES